MPRAAPSTLLVMVPGAGIAAGDFATQGLIAAVAARHPSVAVAVIDPGLDAYLDGSVEARLSAAIARERVSRRRVTLAGISLGCQGILRALRRDPAIADGLILLTPYLASTGRIAAILRDGGLATCAACDDPLLAWLATGPALPRAVIGVAAADRFAGTAALLSARFPAAATVRVPGAHDWASWRALWPLALDTGILA